MKDMLNYFLFESFHNGFLGIFLGCMAWLVIVLAIILLILFIDEFFAQNIGSIHGTVNEKFSVRKPDSDDFERYLEISINSHGDIKESKIIVSDEIFNTHEIGDKILVSCSETFMSKNLIINKIL